MQEEGGASHVRFRPRRLREGVDGGDAERRFITGLVVFLVVVLLYPWYAYRVQAWLTARDLAAAAKALERESVAGAAFQAERAARMARPPEPAYVPPASIRIMGAMELRNGPMAIVDLAGRPLDEVTPILCLRVQEHLGTPTLGREIRVQRWRRNAPAVSMGSVQC